MSVLLWLHQYPAAQYLLLLLLILGNVFVWLGALRARQRARMPKDYNRKRIYMKGWKSWISPK